MRGKLLFVASCAFMVGVLVRTLVVIPWQWVGLCGFIGLLSLAFWGLEKRVGAAAIAVACLMLSLGIVRTAFVPVALPHSFESMLNEEVSLGGVIVADPDVREKNQQLVVEVPTLDLADASERSSGRKPEAETKILVFAPREDAFAFGERVQISGVLTAPTPFSADGGRTFRYDHFLAKKGIFSLIQIVQVSEIAPPKGMIADAGDVLFGIKHAFVAGLVRALPDPYNELATGLLTGDQHQLGDALESTLALSGLIWVVVLSGYHVTLIAEAVLRLFSFLPKRFALTLASACILMIILATGASAPSIRGGMMACFALLAQGSGRRYDALRALAVTIVLVLLWNPLLLAYDSGFQLSCIVTPALILGTPILEYRLLWIKNAFLREVLCVSIIAQLACVPLLLWSTGDLSIWAIPANVLITPIVPIVMLCSVVAGGVGMFLHPLASLAGLPAYVLLSYLLAVAKTSATLPFADVVLPVFPFMFVVAMYAGLITLAWRLRPPPSQIYSQPQTSSHSQGTLPRIRS